MIFSLPLALTSVFLLVLQLHRDSVKTLSREMKFLGFSFFSFGFAMIGYFINTTVLAKIYSFETYNRTWTSFNLKSIFSYWSGFLTLFGYQYPQLWGGSYFNILSIPGFLGMFGLLLMGCLLLSIFLMILHWKKLSFEYLTTILLLLSALLVQGSVFSYTSGNGSGNAQYWLTILPFGFLVMQMAVETEHFQRHYSRQIISVFFLIIVIGCSFSTMVYFFTYPMRAKTTLKPVSDWLVENGYENGYVTTGDFWYSSNITEWSNGQIEMHVTNGTSFDSLYRWLQKKSHAEAPDGKVFVLSTPETEYDYFSILDQGEIVYQDENGYTIFSYDSYDALHLDATTQN